MAGSNVTLYSTTPGSNATVGSINWAEGQAPSTVNDSARLNMADSRSLLNVLATGWLEYGDGDGAYTPTYVSATSFRIDGVDVTSIYHVGRRVRVAAPTPVVIYGTIATSSFSTNTTLTITWDTATQLTNEAITSVMVSPIPATSRSLPSGSIVQVVNTQTGAVATGTTLLPFDDTPPQNGEGDQYMTLAITPKSVGSLLLIQVVCILTNSAGGGRLGAALFQDATAGALASAYVGTNIAGPTTVVFTHKMTAATTSATTFKVRAGNSSAGTTTFNGDASARIHGGVLASSITITEYVA